MASLPPTFVPGFHQEDQVNQLQFRSARISSYQSDPTLLANHVYSQMVSQIQRTSTVDSYSPLLFVHSTSYHSDFKYFFLDRILILPNNYRSSIYRPIRFSVSLT